MRLTNTEGELNLVIAGYQLGEGEYGDGFNCLNVDGTVQHPRGIGGSVENSTRSALSRH